MLYMVNVALYRTQRSYKDQFPDLAEFINLLFISFDHSIKIVTHIRNA